MDEISGLGARVVELLKKNGYESVTGRSKYGVDIARFTVERGYVITMFHKWLSGEARPNDENLLRLARDLGASPGDILFGKDNQPKKAKRIAHPIAGGSDAVVHHGSGENASYQTLLRYWWRSLTTSNRWALA